MHPRDHPLRKRGAPNESPGIDSCVFHPARFPRWLTTSPSSKLNWRGATRLGIEPSTMARTPSGNSASLVASRRLLLLGRAFARQTGQRQIRHDARARLAAGIDDSLVGAAEHALHGFKVDPLPRHVRGLLVLLVDLAEARRLTLGFGDDLFTIGFGVLENLSGAAARFRHDSVGIGLRFVLRALEIG